MPLDFDPQTHSSPDRGADSPLLGDAAQQMPRALPLEKMLEDAAKSPERPLWERGCSILHRALAQAPLQSFCLCQVLEYFRDLNTQFEPEERLGLAHFEVWLNGRGDISAEDQLEIRAKIAGKHLPRRAYQVYFPIGTGGEIEGSHVVTGHSAPDLDTAIASFWGWTDAFAAKVGSQVHSWNLPGGALAPQDRQIFEDLMGPHLLAELPKSRTELALNALDLVDPNALISRSAEQSVVDLADQSRLVVWKDARGYCRGEWRAEDAAAIGRVTGPLAESLLFLEAQLHSHLLASLARPGIGAGAACRAFRELAQQRLIDLTPIAALGQEQREMLSIFVQRLMHLEGGLQTSIEQFLNWAERSAGICLPDLKQGLRDFNALFKSLTFEGAEATIDVQELPEILQIVNSATRGARRALSRLDVQILIKQRVLGMQAAQIFTRAGLEEVRLKLQVHEILTVVYPESAEGGIAIGAIDAKALQRAGLASVTLRDFCNREAVKIPPYFQVISAIDHHALRIQSERVPVLSAADVQSCNVLLAEAAFALNDHFGSGGLESKAVDAQWSEELRQIPKSLSPSRLYLLQRLLIRKSRRQRAGSWFVHPAREWAEYLSFLLAIFDDTDLLSKATPRDVRCVAQLLNRAKSLQVGREVEMISIGDLDEGESFVRAAANRLLRHRETYSIYSRVYRFRASCIERAIRASAEGLSDDFYSDTKEQNNCARVGQSKLFAENLPSFWQNAVPLRARWLAIAQSICSTHPDIDLHLHMCSTIAGADEVLRGCGETESSQLDQLWFWLPESVLARENMAIFLNGLARSRELSEKALKLELINDGDGRLEELCRNCFSNCRLEKTDCAAFEGAMFALHFPAGALNSRKTSISPHLPQGH